MAEDKPKKRKVPKSAPQGSPRGKPAKSRLQKPNPLLRGLITCDQVLLDQFSTKVTLVGIFNAFRFSKFPAVAAPFMIFAEMMDGIGTYVLRLDIIEAKTGNVIGSGDVARIEFAERMQPTMIRVILPPIPFPSPGKYDMVLHADGVELTRATLTCILVSKIEGTEEPMQEKQ